MVQGNTDGGEIRAKARLFGGVGDFDAMDEEAGQDKDRDSETKQTEDGDKRGDGLSDDGENSHGTADGESDGAEMLQIKSDAQPLRPGGENWRDGFPAHQHRAGNDRVFEKKA